MLLQYFRRAQTTVQMFHPIRIGHLISVLISSISTLIAFQVIHRPLLFYLSIDHWNTMQKKSHTHKQWAFRYAVYLILKPLSNISTVCKTSIRLFCSMDEIHNIQLTKMWKLNGNPLTKLEIHPNELMLDNKIGEKFNFKILPCEWE